MANPHLAALHKSVEVNIAQSKKNLKVMKDLCTELCGIRDRCRIASTAGNSASIVGACLSIVFPPVGIPLLASGVATNLGTKAVLRQQSIEWKAKLDAIMLNQKEADQAVANHLKLLLETLKGAAIVTGSEGVEKIRQLKQAADLVSMMNKVCWNLPLSSQHRPSADHWAQVGRSMGALSIAANIVGVGISAYDIYATWTTENTTVTDFNTQIGFWKKMVADKEKDLLHIMKVMS